MNESKILLPELRNIIIEYTLPSIMTAKHCKNDFDYVFLRVCAMVKSELYIVYGECYENGNIDYFSVKSNIKRFIRSEKYFINKLEFK